MSSWINVGQRAGNFYAVCTGVFLLVFGAYAVLAPAELALGAAVGLATGLLVGGMSEWQSYLRQKHRMLRNVFPVMVAAGFAVTVTMPVVRVFFGPPCYSATAVMAIRFEGGDGEMQSRQLQVQSRLLESDALLEQVVERLNLNKKWAETLAGGAKLKISETLPFLRRKLGISVVNSRSEIRICAMADDPGEAAAIANALATAHRQHVEDQHSGGRALHIAGAEMIQEAHAIGPLRPNGLWFFGRFWEAFLVAAVAGAGAAGAAHLCFKPQSLRLLVESGAFGVLCAGGMLWVSVILDERSGPFCSAIQSLFGWLLTFYLGALGCAVWCWVASTKCPIKCAINSR
jgi:capsular polysaccharide biosynthesis protein